jgi:hypothetical protein
MEEEAYPKMEALLYENGLQVTLKIFIDALDKLIKERGNPNIVGKIVLESLKGIHAGYCRRNEPGEV